MTGTDKKILGTGPIDKLAVDILVPYGEIIEAPDAREETLLELLEGVVGLVVRGDGIATTKMIERASDLKVIGRTGVGYDMVDIQAATRRRIPVVNTPGQNARAVAEGAFAFLIALCKSLPHWDRQMQQGNWNSRFESKTGDLDGQTLGIVGLGNSGRILAELARPFGMTVLACDPFVSQEDASNLGAELTDLESLLKRSKFISLHAPLTQETRGMINRQRLASVQPGSYLINMARGGLIETLDILHEALLSGTLAGVGLDVFEPEPPDSGHPIFQMTNCLTSPHALAMTDGAMARIFKSMAQDMAAIFRGEKPRFVVNPEVLD